MTTLKLKVGCCERVELLFKKISRVEGKKRVGRYVLVLIVSGDLPKRLSGDMTHELSVLRVRAGLERLVFCLLRDQV